MSGNYLRRAAAVACPIHRMIKDEAIQRLAHSGIFNKEEVLLALRFQAVSDSIRWDYIREFIQEDQGCELVPLAASYFTRHPRAEEHVNTGKFLAQGHGKKTAGYASVIQATDHLVVARIQYRESRKNGVVEKFAAYKKAVEKRRQDYLPEPEPEPTLTRLTQT
jgi:hypothetical protein